jgi:Skp family chaperone for outer membrane proteins
MRTTVIALSCLTGIVVSFAAGSAGGSKAVAPAPGVQSIGVVRVVVLLLKLSEAGKLEEAVKADQSKAQAELAVLAKEIQTEEQELTILKTTSEDYLKQSQTLAERKAHFSARREFLDRQIRLKQELWMQKAYGQVVRATREVAAEKGLSLVLVKDDPNTAPESEGIRRVIATQKVLYCDGCPDITPEVQARLMAGAAYFPRP